MACHAPIGVRGVSGRWLTHGSGHQGGIPTEMATACAFLHEVLNEGAEAVKAIGDHATCGVALWAQAMVSGDCDCCEEGFDDAYFGDDEDDEDEAGDSDEDHLDGEDDADLSEEEEEALQREAERFAFASIAGIMTPEGAAAFAARMQKRH